MLCCPIQLSNLLFQLVTVAMILVVVPVTAATVERSFSDMKLVKTRHIIYTQTLCADTDILGGKLSIIGRKLSGLGRSFPCAPPPPEMKPCVLCKHTNGERASLTATFMNKIRSSPLVIYTFYSE